MGDMAQDRYKHQKQMKMLDNEFEIRLNRSEKLTDCEVKQRLDIEQQKLKYKNEKDMFELKKDAILDFIGLFHSMGINPFKREEFLNFARKMMRGTQLEITDGPSISYSTI
ncbi:uncharacterized protein LOC144420836 isoform X2 [Styela clava]